MKKLISIILTLALLAGCIALFPATASADSTIVTFNDDPVTSYTEIFDSKDYSGHVNSSLVTDTDKGYWLGGTAWLSGNTANQSGLYMGKNGVTANILGRNGVDASAIADFEWQFDIIADATTAGNIETSFAFHVGEGSSTESYLKKHNLFAVTLYGADIDASRNCVVPNALVIEYCSNSYNNAQGLGYTRPYNYSTATTPWSVGSESYIKLDDASAETAIDISQYATFNIKMEGAVITVSTWQTNNKESTFRQFSVNMHASAVRAMRAGDFAILASSTSGNFKVKDMTVTASNLVYSSDRYANNWLVQNDGNADLTYQSGAKTVGNMTATGNVYTLPRYSATNEIMESALGNEVNLTDFIWETEIAIDGSEPNADFASFSLNFHIDKDRTDTPSKIPGDAGITIGMDKRRYMQGIGIYGDSMETAESLGTSGVAVHSSIHPTTGTPGFVMAAQRVTVAKPSNAEATYFHAASSVPLSSALKKNVYYTIRIVVSGKDVYTYIWETANKADTLRSVYHQLTDAQLASATSGDFAIINENLILNIKNMRIWKGTEGLTSAEDYTAYTSLVPATTYTFDEDFGGITKPEDNVSSMLLTGGKLQLHTATDTVAVQAKNLDNGNLNLKDFIITYDFETATGSNVNWSLDWLYFKTKNNNNYYRLEFMRQGRSSNTNFDYVAISRKVNGVEEVLGKASLSRAFTPGNSFKVKLEVINNVYKVYLGNDEIFTTPILVCADDGVDFSGETYIYHNNGIAYYDNITIYDITATEAAKTINDIPLAEAVRGDEADVAAAKTVFNALDPVQQTKLAAQKTAIDSAEAKLASLEKAAHDINDDTVIDICDLVKLDLGVKGTEALAADKDPVLDGKLDAADLIQLRGWILNLIA